VETLTREAIADVLGPVDDATAAEIAQVGATRTELAEAHAWLVSDEAMINEMRPLPKGRVAQVLEILRAMGMEDDDV